MFGLYKPRSGESWDDFESTDYYSPGLSLIGLIIISMIILILGTIILRKRDISGWFFYNSNFFLFINLKFLIIQIPSKMFLVRINYILKI